MPWEAVGECHWTPICEEGVCARGTCWAEPLRASALADLDAGLGTEGWPIEVELLEDPSGTGSRLRVRPLRALPAHTPIELVLGEGVRGLAGQPTVDMIGQEARIRRTLVTADEGSSGPEPRLVAPVPGELGVPTNLAVLETSFAVPVALPLPTEASLVLEAEEGPDVALGEPVPCPGWVPGSCVRWTVLEPLAPDTRYRPGPGTVLDRRGDPALRPAVQTWFRTGAGPDLEPPIAVDPRWAVDGPCLVLELWTAEAARLELVGPGEARAHTEGAGWLRIGLPLRQLAAGTVLGTLTDRAGGEALLQHTFEGSEAPPLAISEVLANPLGPEPAAEFVELVALEAGSTEGLWIADQPWPEIEAALADGEAEGDPLPEAWLEAGEVAIVVASGYPGAIEPGDPTDPAPEPGARWLVVDASIGHGGLKNAGEVISLYRADPPQLVSSYGDWLEAESGVSAVRLHPQACDSAAAWRPHPEGRSGPGRLP